MFLSTKPALCSRGLVLSRLSGCSWGLFWESVGGRGDLCCWEVSCRIISLSKHPSLLRYFSNCLNCFVQGCVCLELSGNSQEIQIYERHIFGNTYWRTFFFQNMLFPSSAVRVWFGFFPSSFSAFLPVKSMFLKNNTPCLWAVDSTFMLLIFFCHFFFSPLWSLVSSLSCPQITSSLSVHLSPHYCKLFYLFPCWHLLFTTPWHICANLFLAFLRCVYVTQTFELVSFNWYRSI